MILFQQEMNAINQTTGSSFMKMYIGALFVTITILQGITVGADKGAKNSNNSGIRYSPQEPEKTYLEKLLADENKNIGAKNFYGKAVGQAYQQYVKAQIAGDDKKAEQYWLQVQNMRQKYSQTPTPLTFYGIKGAFGYWLYRRLAYPANKSNWGMLRTNIARVAIPAWVFQSALFADADLDKKKETVIEEKDKEIKALKEKCAEHEANEKEFHNALDHWTKMSLEQRKTWMTAKQIADEEALAKAVNNESSNQEEKPVSRSKAFVEASRKGELNKQSLDARRAEVAAIEAQVWWKQWAVCCWFARAFRV